MKTLKTLLYALVLISVTFSGCKEKDQKEEKVDIGFSEYISGFTSGVVNSQSSVQVILSEPLPEEKLKNPDELLKITPEIPGKVVFKNNRIIEFVPDDLIPLNKEFEAKFYLGKLKQVPSRFSTLKFSFKTTKQNYSVDLKGLSAYETDNLKNQMLKGEVTSAAYVKKEWLEGFVAAKQNKRRLPVTWSATADGRTHYFTVDSIRRTREAETVTLEFKGDAIYADKDEQKKFEVPPLSVFKVMDIVVVQEPDQHVIIRFSDPLQKDQDLRGLVRFSENIPHRTVISGNNLKVFPEQRQQGNVELMLDKAVKNVSGYQLDADYENVIIFATPKPKVEFLAEGNILPSSNGLVIPFKAVSLKGLNVRIIRVFEDNVPQFLQVNQFSGDKELKRVGRIVFQDDILLDKQQSLSLTQWNTFRLDISEFIEVEPGAIYEVQLNFNRSQSLYNCGEEEEEEPVGEDDTDFRIVEDNQNDEDYWSWSGFNSVDYRGYYDWRNRDNPCSDSYYQRFNQAVSKNVLASDFGIIAKQGETNQLDIHINHIVDTKPLSGVAVEVFNFQHRKVGEGITNNQGRATVDLSGKGFLIIAKKDDEYGYVRIDDGSALSMSMFDVGGSSSEKGIKGFLYGERDVWRPGDSLFVSLILEDKNAVLPEKHPVVFELTDPQGRMVARKVTPLRSNGMFVFRSATEKDAITGRYMLKAKLGGLEFYKAIRIETIKPNRLKIDLDFGKQMLTHDDDKLKADLHVKWLHGATAGNLKADIEMKAYPAKTTFKKYEQYKFTDPSKKLASRAKVIFDDKLSSQGHATVNHELDFKKQAPGMINLNFRMRAFEKSGEFSTTTKTVKYSPYESYVGINVPKGDGWNGALSSTQKHHIPVVTLDENGEEVNKKLKIEVYRVNWRWWWDNRHNRDMSRFVTSRHAKLIQDKMLITRDGEGSFSFKMEEKYWGRVFIRVTDVVSGHSTGKVVMMDYPGWWHDQDDNTPGGATMLSFSLDKDQYETGDQVRVKIPSAAGSRILVSIENNNKVLKSEWIDSQQEFTEYTFEVTPEMAPNAYVFVALVQQHNQTLNDRPIRLYGVQPLFVEDPESHLEPQIDMPSMLKPEEEVAITVSEDNGQAMSYTLAVVDEGLLDITAYKTPEPWKYFNARKALGVKTWDIYDAVIGAFGAEYAALLKPGGGVEIDPDAADKSAMRFKPVVKFFGPFFLEPGAENTHRFMMPNYVGSVKAMVVAAHQGKYGHTDKAVPVKKPLMTVATAPRVIRPGEVMDVPVTVISMEDGMGEVDVRLEVSEKFEIIGETLKKVSFEERGEKMAFFRVKAKETLGTASLDVNVRGGGENARYHIDMNILAANPPQTKTTTKSLEPGETLDLSYETFGVEGTNEVVLEVTSLVPMDLEKRLKYLIRYPHGCIEQIVSGVFPQLSLGNLTELSSEEKKEIQDNVQAAINKLSDFQMESGGFGYWPASYVSINNWGTNYAGHFLVEAQKKGYALPEGMLRHWLSYQQRAARNFTNLNGLSKHSSLTQAYRLYTMALAGEPSAGDMNRLREEENLNEMAAWRLAAAYAVSGKTSVAEKLTGRLLTEPEAYDQPGSTFGSRLRDLAMILETLSLMGDDERGMVLMRDIARQLSESRWYSTQTTAYSLLAMSKYTEEMNLNSKVEFSVSENGSEPAKKISDKILVSYEPDIQAKKSGILQVKNEGEGSVFAVLQETGIPVAGKEEKIRKDLFMDVKYTDTQGNQIDPKRLIQGTDMIVEIKVTHPGIRGDYSEMALTQIMPSGWEIRNTRLNEVPGTENNQESFEYQDIRDDRVYTYFDLERKESKVFRIQVNATYTGKYYLPGISCEAMYDNSITAQQPGMWVEVMKATE